MGGWTRKALWGCITLSVLAAPPTASASDLVIGGGPLIAGPRFAGSDVVRLTEGVGGTLRVDRFDAGGNPNAPRVSVPAEGELVGWDASSAMTVFDRGQFTGLGRQGLVRDFENLDVLMAGGLQRVLACPREQAHNALGFALDGPNLAYVRKSCSPYAPADVVIRDMKSAVEHVVTVDRGVTHLALAGDYLAVGGPSPGRSGDSPAFHLNGSSDYVAVYDWKASRLLHFYEGSRAAYLPITGFDVQADGKVAFVGSDSGCPDVAWFQTGDPTVHRLPICSGANIYGSGVKIAGDRIATTASAPGSTNTDRRYALVVSDLSGAAQTVAAGTLDPPSQFRRDFGSAFDFDGSRVAFALGECDQTSDRLLVSSLDSPPVAVKDRSCPIQIPRRSVRLTRSGAVTFEVRCPEGCRPRAAFLERDGGVLASRNLGALIRRGETRQMSVKLYPRRFRRVKREGRIRLDILVNVPTSHGTTQSLGALTGVVLRWPPR